MSVGENKVSRENNEQIAKKNLARSLISQIQFYQRQRAAGFTYIVSDTLFSDSKKKGENKQAAATALIAYLENYVSSVPDPQKNVMNLTIDQYNALIEKYLGKLYSEVVEGGLITLSQISIPEIGEEKKRVDFEKLKTENLTTVSRLNSELSEVRSQLAELNEAKAALEEQNATHEAVGNALSSSLSEAQNTITTINGKIQSLKTEKRQLEAQLSHLRSEFAQQKENESKLNKELLKVSGELRTERVSHGTAARAVLSENVNLKEVNNRFISKIKELETQQKGLEASLKENKTTLIATKRQLYEVRQQLQQSESKSENLEQHVSQLSQENASIRSELETVNGVLEADQKLKDEINSLKIQIQKDKEQIKRLNRTNDELSVLNRDRTNEVSNIRRQLQEKTKKLEQIQIKLEGNLSSLEEVRASAAEIEDLNQELLNTVASNNEKIVELGSELEEVRGKNTESESTIDELRKGIEEAEQKAANLEAELAASQATNAITFVTLVAQLHAQAEREKSLHGEMSKLKDEIASKGRLLEYEKGNNGRLSEEADGLKSKISSLKGQLANAEQSINVQKDKVADANGRAQKATKDLNASEKTRLEQLAELEKSKEQIIVLKKENGDIREEGRKKDQALGKLRGEMKTLQTDHANEKTKLKDEIQWLREKNKRDEEKVASLTTDLQQSQEQAKAAETAKEVAAEQMKSLREELTSAQAANSSLSAENSSLKIEAEQTKSEYTSKLNDLIGQNAAEKQKTANLQADLAEMGAAFIFAIHALKTYETRLEEESETLEKQAEHINQLEDQNRKKQENITRLTAELKNSQQSAQREKDEHGVVLTALQSEKTKAEAELRSLRKDLASEQLTNRSLTQQLTDKETANTELTTSNQKLTQKIGVLEAQVAAASSALEAQNAAVNEANERAVRATGQLKASETSHAEALEKAQSSTEQAMMRTRERETQLAELASELQNTQTDIVSKDDRIAALETAILDLDKQHKAAMQVLIAASQKQSKTLETQERAITDAEARAAALTETKEITVAVANEIAKKNRELNREKEELLSRITVLEKEINILKRTPEVRIAVSQNQAETVEAQETQTGNKRKSSKRMKDHETQPLENIDKITPVVSPRTISSATTETKKTADASTATESGMPAVPGVEHVKPDLSGIKVYAPTTNKTEEYKAKMAFFKSYSKLSDAKYAAMNFEGHLTEAEAKEFKENGIQLISPAGIPYHFSKLTRDGEVPKAFLSYQDLDKGDAAVSHEEKLAKTIINIIDNVLSKSAVIEIETSDPFAAAIAEQYLGILKTKGLLIEGGGTIKCPKKDDEEKTKANTFFEKEEIKNAMEHVEKADWFKEAGEFRTKVPVATPKTN